MSQKSISLFRSELTRHDRLVNPDLVPSPHLHQIVGGNAFNASIPTTDVSKIATCTTCSFDQDFSNYWTANLYFKARNGTYKRVPQIANQGLNGDNGGVTVYYTSPGAKQTTAFKPVCISSVLHRTVAVVWYTFPE
jgi:hypothetical protein